MKMTMKQINRYLFPLLILIAVFLAFNRPKTFTKEQRLIIRQSDSVMYVTVWPEDSAILRTPCVDFTKAELKSKDLQTLMAKMLATVRAPQHDGVGIAGPQVGIGKRIIWLQRLDKEGGPFECYLNVRIDCDHLEGRLYIDRADTVYVSTAWEAERRAYDYSKPDWWPLQ